MKITIGTKEMIMILTLIVAGICGGKVIQEVAIVRYAVFWYFLRTFHGLAAEVVEVKAYVFSRILYTSICSFMTGVFLVVSSCVGVVILQKKTKSNLKKYLVMEVAAILLTVLFGAFAIRYIQSLTQHGTPFLAQKIGSDIWNEYQIHVASKVRPVAIFSFLTGGFIAIFFRFLKDLMMPPAEKDVLETFKYGLAKGDITPEEYKKIKSMLEKD